MQYSRNRGLKLGSMAKLFHWSRLTQLMINANIPYLCLAHRLMSTLTLTKMLLNRNKTFWFHVRRRMYPRTQLFGLIVYVMSLRPQIKMLSCMGRGALALTFWTSQNMTFFIDRVLRVYQVNDLCLYKLSTKNTWQITTINQQIYPL